MSTSWEQKRLGDLATVIMGQSPKSEYYNDQRNGLPFFQGNRDFGELYPSATTYCSQPSKIAHPGDILMSVRAPVGALNIADEECCIGRGLCAMRSKRPKRFIFYLLRANIENIRAAESGAVFGAVNKADLNSLLLLIPSDEQVQEKIAAILSAYDDLIDNNLRRIKILEEMAQMLYREWFVNFRFPGHEKVKMVDSPLGRIPEGWKAKRLDELVLFQNNNTEPGEHLSNRAYLPIDCIPRKSFAICEVKTWQEAQSSLILFDEGDILFGAMRPYFHKVVVAPFKGVTRKTCFVFKSISSEYHAFAALALFQETTVSFANAHSKGSTIPYASWSQSMDSMPIVVPPITQAKRFEEIVSPMISNIGTIYFQNNNLRQTRDLLLPKLISGEVDVSELDIAIPEEVA